ncbi:hypothetical protein NDU88_000105 [Pleurodeles waltl]|uniref:Uncharacterized protein n=1 Tax=Pleurodeles waltl TaxID=8319 RepID=A0AAV7P356_PLEWA|nr:hypothetical protein NDU88_000105 [Pleurodeles waltl]
MPHLTSRSCTGAAVATSGLHTLTTHASPHLKELHWCSCRHLRPPHPDDACLTSPQGAALVQLSPPQASTPGRLMPHLTSRSCTGAAVATSGLHTLTTHASPHLKELHRSSCRHLRPPQRDDACLASPQGAALVHLSPPQAATP